MGVFRRFLASASRIWRAASSCACTACITFPLARVGDLDLRCFDAGSARTVTSSSTGHDSEEPVSQFGVSGRMPSAGLGGSVPDVNPLPRTHNDAKRSSRGRYASSDGVLSRSRGALGRLGFDDEWVLRFCLGRCCAAREQVNRLRSRCARRRFERTRQLRAADLLGLLGADELGCGERQLRSRA